MVEPGQVDYVYTFNVEAPGFLALNYNIQEKGQKTQRWADIYDWQGQPLQLAEDYFQIENMYNFYYMKELHNVRTERTGYYHGEDIFWVQQGFSRGLMNCKGEWLFKESVFADLED